MSLDTNDVNGDSRRDPFRPGLEFAHYKIIERLGAGGMGNVFLARDLSLNRQVAIKFMPDRLCTDLECRDRFRHEAQAAAALNHPNIVTVHEVGCLDDRPYYVMEFVQGNLLADLTSSTQISIKAAVDIARQVSAGLREAYGAGIVHRDIKPSNIIIDDNGTAKILDFGISCSSTQLPSSQTTEGTISYMAPEIVMGQDPSHSSDLFSLGVMLYEALSGTKPFKGRYDAAIMYSIANEAAQPLRTLRPEIPEQLELIVSRLLEKDPSKRYSNASELTEALDNLSMKLDSHDKSTERKSPMGWRVAAAFVLIAAAMITLSTLISTGDKEVSTPQRKWLAVLPFENLGFAEDDYFADGTTDALTLHLAKLNDLHVVSRSSSMKFKHSDHSISEIGKALGVSYVVTGSVQWDRKDSNRVRISASLVRIPDDEILWGDSYNLVLGSLFDLQTELSGRIASALHVAINEEYRRAISRQPTESVEAYNLFLKGNEYFNRSWDRKDIEIAIEMYERTLAIDSEFASAHAMASRGHASLFWESYDRTPERYKKAFNHARKSLIIDPSLPMGFLALGYCYYHCDGHYESAIDQFHSALRIQPSNADIYNAIAAIHRRTGQLDSSIVYFQKAFEFDPMSHLKALDIGLTFCMKRNYDSTRVYIDRAIMLSPGLPLPYIIRAWVPVLESGDTATARSLLREASAKVSLSQSQHFWWLSRIICEDYNEVIGLPTPTTEKDTVSSYLFLSQIYRLLGDQENERRYAELCRIRLEADFDSLTQDARVHSYLSLAYAGLRQKETAYRHGELAMLFLPVTHDAFDAPFYMLNLAEVYTIFGDHDSAFEQLRDLVNMPGFVSIPYLELDPIWEPLKSHDGFKALIANSAVH